MQRWWPSAREIGGGFDHVAVMQTQGEFVLFSCGRLSQEGAGAGELTIIDSEIPATSVYSR